MSGQSSRRAFEHVDGCEAMVVVMSQAADRSDWVRREITRAQQQDKLILPLLLRGAASFMLNTTQFEDVTGGRLPTQGFVERLRAATGNRLKPGVAR